jgi:hypothetical protein
VVLGWLQLGVQVAQVVGVVLPVLLLELMLQGWVLLT